MITILKRVSVFALSVLMFFICSSNTVLGVKEKCSHNRRTFNDKKLSGGVGNYGNNDRYYWIDSNFSGNYTTRVQNAFKHWVFTSTNPGVTTPISIVQTTQKSASTFDIYKKSLSGNTTGITKFYSDSSSVNDPSSQNWTWVKIQIDQAETSSYGNMQKTGLVAHEIGHAMGLSHQPNNQYDSLMYNYDNGRKFSENGDFRNRPSKRDCNNINHIY